MNKLFISLFVFFSLAVVFQACETVKQASEITRLKECTFSYEGIQALKLAGIDLGDGTSANGMQGGQLMQLANALFQKNLPVNLNVLIKAENPNAKPASLSKMEYVVLLDGMDLFAGQSMRQYTIEPGGYTVLSLPLETELFKAMSEQSKEKISALINKFSGKDKNPVEITVKVKPYLNVGGATMPYPGYLTFIHKLQKN